MTPALIAAYGKVDKLVSHLHLPVQSGSDRVLAAMKRGYTALEYKSIVRRMRAVRPDVSLTSDFIVGFPGETDADFEQTMKLVDDVKFDGAFNFAYSPRPGTPAAELAEQVKPEVQQARLERLSALLDAQYRTYSEAMVGTRQRALVTGHAARGSGELAARTENNRVVNFAGDAALIGRYAELTITAALAHSLRGELLTVRRGGVNRGPSPLSVRRPRISLKRSAMYRLSTPDNLRLPFGAFALSALAIALPVAPASPPRTTLRLRRPPP